VADQTASIRIRILGAIRAALEAETAADALDQLSDQTDEAARAAIRATFALKRIRAQLRKLAAEGTLAAAGMVVFRTALAGLGLVALGVASLALPALAIALYNVAVAAGVVAAAFTGGLLGAFAAALLMGVAVIDRFKQMSGVIGSAANELANAGYLIRGAFRDATASGADALMRGLAAGLVKLEPLIRGLESSFTAIGKAFGSMFDRLFTQIAGMGPELRRMFDALIPVIHAAGGALGQFLRLFVQVATVGAPLVVDAFNWLSRKMAAWTESFTGEKVNGALGTLKAFAGGVRAFTDAFAAPIKPFFADAMAEFGEAWKTLGPSIGTVLGTIVAAFMKLGRAALPYVTKAFEWLAAQMPGVLSWLGKAGGALLEAFKDVAPFITNVLWPVLKGIFKSLAPVFAIVFKAIGLVAQALGWVGEKAAPLKGVFEFIGRVIGVVFGPAIIGGIGKLLTGLGSVGSRGMAVFRAIAGAISSVGRAIGWLLRGIGWVVGQISLFGRTVAAVAGEFWGTFKDAAVSAFNWIKGAIGDVIDFIGSLPGRIKKGVTGALGSIPGVGGALRGLGIIGNAKGGTITRPGLSWVGERGPELVSLPKSSTVFTSAESRRIASHDRPQATQAAPTTPAMLQPWTLVLPNMREIARGVQEVNLADVALRG
jgi:hypothetical protein